MLTAAEAARGGAVRVSMPVFGRCTAVDIVVAPMTRAGTILQVGLHRLGIHDFFLRLHVSVET